MDLSFNMHRDISFGMQTVSQYIAGLGVERMKVLSEEDYQAIAVPDEKTLYLVQTENGIKFYLGNVSLYADGIPADVEQELRRIAAIAEANQTALETVVIPTLTGQGEAIQELQNTLNDMIKLVHMTQAEYDELDVYDDNTLYILT